MMISVTMIQFSTIKTTSKRTKVKKGVRQSIKMGYPDNAPPRIIVSSARTLYYAS